MEFEEEKEQLIPDSRDAPVLKENEADGIPPLITESKVEQQEACKIKPNRITNPNENAIPNVSSIIKNQERTAST